MNYILTEMVNQLAPLVVQIVGIVLLAVLSAILLKAREILQTQLSAQQRSFLAELASTAVHMAETEGLDKTGAQKAAMAQKYVGDELAQLGVKTASSADVEATIVGAVQRAWQREIGPTFRMSEKSADEVAPAQPSSAPVLEPPAPAPVPAQP